MYSCDLCSACKTCAEYGPFNQPYCFYSYLRFNYIEMVKKKNLLDNFLKSAKNYISGVKCVWSDGRMGNLFLEKINNLLRLD